MRGFCFYFGLLLMAVLGLVALAVFTFYLYQMFIHLRQFAFLW